MPKYIDINNPVHNWEKQNLVTESDSNGSYDRMKCGDCGITGKRRNISIVEVDGRLSDEKIRNCIGNNIDVPSKIQITNCTASGSQFANLQPNSIHQTVIPPKGYNHDKKGVWVMGVGEPVKVLTNEFKPVN